jgi:hypothetical protein
MRRNRQGAKGVTPNLYLAIMLTVIVVITVAVLPSLLTKKCPGCGARNGLDSPACRKCNSPFPESGEDT